MKYIIPGIKTILISIAKCNPPPPLGVSEPDYNSVARGFTDDQLEIFVLIIEHGLACFHYFNLENFDENGVLKQPADQTAGLSKEDKDAAMEGFASIFKSIEPCAFLEVWEFQLDYFFKQCCQNSQLLAIPQYFLVTPSVPSNFAGLLLRYLIDHMELLGKGGVASTSNEGIVMMKMFKVRVFIQSQVLFLAVSMFPEKNEPMLIHHIAPFVMGILKWASKSSNSLNYFLVLRNLFRAISGGKFEKLYNAVLPLLPVLLETLNLLLDTAQDDSMRDLFVELCLTVWCI